MAKAYPLGWLEVFAPWLLGLLLFHDNQSAKSKYKYQKLMVAWSKMPPKCSMLSYICIPAHMHNLHHQMHVILYIIWWTCVYNTWTFISLQLCVSLLSRDQGTSSVPSCCAIYPFILYYGSILSVMSVTAFISQLFPLRGVSTIGYVTFTEN